MALNAVMVATELLNYKVVKTARWKNYIVKPMRLDSKNHMRHSGNRATIEIRYTHPC